MNERKIAFLMCSNKEQYEREALHYIEALNVPAGYEIETVVIRDAASMAEGYNRAMNASDAKYKVYLHQDVMIIERDFIRKILHIFEDRNIGCIGMVGTEKLPENAVMWYGERIGAIWSNYTYYMEEARWGAVEGDYQKVEAVDGLLMATQYDIRWREDIFKAWDFYDVSQSREFIKHGYDVVVPNMQSPWCLHDCGVTESENYFKERKKFVREYMEAENIKQVDEKQIAFIMCVNDEEQAKETRDYIDRLIVPEGYTVDVIAVWEAESMTAGYNAAMQSSSAVYKVYLHQDTRIINRNFIADMLEVFASDETIGMLGCVGCESIPANGQAVAAWDVGMVYHNCIPNKMIRRQSEKREFLTVEALDGLLLATRTDIPWREDLFDGWDFYDISQCLEMQRAGYRVVVPFQEEPWCYHDNFYSKMQNYYKYCERMVAEYQDIKPFYMAELPESRRELEEIKETARWELQNLVERNDREGLLSVFEEPENLGWLHLKDFEILAEIVRTETSQSFWEDGEDFKSLCTKIREIHFSLKRIEFHQTPVEEEKELLRKYSRAAVAAVLCAYTEEPQEIWKEIE